jgi:hypothetical protein
MIKTREKTQLVWPSRSAFLRGGAVVLGLVLGVGLARALVLFPFEPPLAVPRLLVAGGGVVLFVNGLLLLMLGSSLALRMIGAQGMSLAAATVFISLSVHAVAWFMAFLGLLAAAGMSLWGAFLAKGIRVSGEEGRR